MAMPLKYMLGQCHKAAFATCYGWRSRSWQTAVEQHRPTSENFVVSGFFNEALGIGRAGQLVANALEKAGFNVVREDLRAFDRGLLTRRPHAFPEGRTADTWLIQANPPEARIALYSHDHEVWRKLYRIGFWHWESDLAPPSWAAMAQWFHEIWVSSAFTASALEAAMLEAGAPEHVQKLRVLPLPVAVMPDHPALAANERIEVITMFDPRSHFDRKNPMAVIETWLTLFPQAARQAHLTVKTLEDATGYPAFDVLAATTRRREDITLLCQTLSQAETEALIRRSHILVSLHRGEGFGLPLAEAMGMGLSVLATGWSGNMQFMTAENSRPVPYRLVPASAAYNGPRARWAEPDVSAAAELLKTLIEDGQLRRTLARQARVDIAALADMWSPDIWNAG